MGTDAGEFGGKGVASDSRQAVVRGTSSPASYQPGIGSASSEFTLAHGLVNEPLLREGIEDSAGDLLEPLMTRLKISTR